MIDEKKLIEELQTLADKESKKCEEAVEANLADVAATYNHGEICYQNAVETVNSQPKIGEWIPCSERLPDKEAKEYIKNELEGIGYLYPLLLTYRSPNTEKVHVVRFYWNVYDKEFVNNGEKTCDMDRCIAWQPLPEPYHE